MDRVVEPAQERRRGSARSRAGRPGRPRRRSRRRCPRGRRCRAARGPGRGAAPARPRLPPRRRRRPWCRAAASTPASKNAAASRRGVLAAGQGEVDGAAGRGTDPPRGRRQARRVALLHERRRHRPLAGGDQRHRPPRQLRLAAAPRVGAGTRTTLPGGSVLHARERRRVRREPARRREAGRGLLVERQVAAGGLAQEVEPVRDQEGVGSVQVEPAGEAEPIAVEPQGAGREVGLEPQVGRERRRRGVLRPRALGQDGGVGGRQDDPVARLLERRADRGAGPGIPRRRGPAGRTVRQTRRHTVPSWAAQVWRTGRLVDEAARTRRGSLRQTARNSMAGAGAPVVGRGPGIDAASARRRRRRARGGQPTWCRADESAGLRPGMEGWPVAVRAGARHSRTAPRFGHARVRRAVRDDLVAGRVVVLPQRRRGPGSSRRPAPVRPPPRASAPRGPARAGSGRPRGRRRPRRAGAASGTSPHRLDLSGRRRGARWGRLC